MKVFYRELVKQGKDIKWLSDKLGISHQTVYGWKNGQYTPKPQHLLQMSKLLKLDMEVLIKDFME